MTVVSRKKNPARREKHSPPPPPPPKWSFPYTTCIVFSKFAPKALTSCPMLHVSR